MSEIDNTDNLGWNSNSNLEYLFYTVDNTLDRMMDDEILSEILKYYPGFNDMMTTTYMKKCFLEIISNEKLINKVMKKYELKLVDLFGIFYRKYPSLFDTANYIKKIRTALDGKSYAIF